MVLINSQDVLSDFSWATAVSGYEWFEVESPTDGRPSALLLAARSESHQRQYKPLVEYPGIHRTFAALSERGDIPVFADRYGLLGPPLTSRSREVLAGPMISGEYFDDWQEEIQKLNSAVSLWDAASSNQSNMLGTKLRWDGPSVVMCDSNELVVSTNTHPEVLHLFSKGDLRGPALYRVGTVINQRLEELGARPKIVLRAMDAELVATWTVKSLLGAIWIDFFLAVGSKKSAEAYCACMMCSHYFERAKKRRGAMYCSDACKSRAYRRGITQET